VKNVRTLAAAALTVAALAAPAGAEPAVPQNGVVYSVSTSSHEILSNRIDATCVFVADRWTDDFGSTRVEVVATTSAAVQVEVRCELYQNGWTAGDETWWANGPVLHGTGRMGHLPPSNVVLCVESTALFAERYVTTPRVCRSL
jgi:hypothetical protein